MNMIENGVINHPFDWLMQPDYRIDSSGHLRKHGTTSAPNKIN